MATYCEKGQQATIKASYPGGQITQNFATCPVDVELRGGTPDIKCWRFWSTNNGIVTDEFFACGMSGYYVPVPDDPNNAAYLYIDGNNAAGTNTGFYSGTFHEVTYARFVEVVATLERTPGANSGGNCPCLQQNCTITATDINSGIQMYQGSVPVSCDQVTLTGACDGCLPGQIQCTCDNYPGYCCVDCAPIEAKIETMTQQVKRLIPNVG